MCIGCDDPLVNLGSDVEWTHRDTSTVNMGADSDTSGSDHDADTDTQDLPDEDTAESADTAPEADTERVPLDTMATATDDGDTTIEDTMPPLSGDIDKSGINK